MTRLTRRSLLFAAGALHTAMARKRSRLARVNVVPTRVIRSMVGLRPFRPSGFVVRAEKLDAKTVIHNYGHGGAGITLSWGTSQLAIE
jgi:glycine/D-amino acid oxidase-like deaminating enzyme